MSQHFDLIVIGAGMAGAAAANKCASPGRQVAIVDALPYGGHIANMDDLLDGMVDVVAVEIKQPPINMPWRLR